MYRAVNTKLFLLTSGVYKDSTRTAQWTQNYSF